MDCNVLITGEDGTGKDQIAQSIHDHSKRSKRPFIQLNCRAIDDNTSFEQIGSDAAGGTLFLDDLHLLPPKYQITLLHLLSGARAESEKSSPRLRTLAGSSQPAGQFLASSFHRDLLYRLSAVHIHVPALRERTEDIPLLANHYVRKFSRKQRKQVNLPDETTAWMKTLSWPGNITELQTAMERAVTFNTSGEILKEDLIRFNLQSSQNSNDIRAELEEAGLAIQKALEELRSKRSDAELTSATEAVEILLKKIRNSR